MNRLTTFFKQQILGDASALKFAAQPQAITVTHDPALGQRYTSPNPRAAKASATASSPNGPTPRQLAPLTLPAMATVAGGGVVGTALGHLGSGLLSLLAFPIFRKSTPEAIETRYAQENQKWLSHFNGAKPMSESVEARLFAHAQKMQSPVSEADICKYVAVGAAITQALAKSTGEVGRPGEIVLDLPAAAKPQDRSSATPTRHTIHSSTYTTEAITWYLMAKAAEADLTRIESAKREGSDAQALQTIPSAMAEEGTFVIPDPGHRLQKFLAANPMCGHRASTHFEGSVKNPQAMRLGGVVPKIQHFGTDSLSKRFPGKGGAIVFNAIERGDKDATYIKIEGEGCSSPAGDLGTLPLKDRVGLNAINQFNFLHHSLSFLTSRGDAKGKKASVSNPMEGTVMRHEHLHKGRSKPLFDELKALLKDGEKSGLLKGDIHKIVKQIEKGGYPTAIELLSELENAAPPQGGEEALGDLQKLSASAKSLRKRFEEDQQHLALPGMEKLEPMRRGSEVILDLLDTQSATSKPTA